MSCCLEYFHRYLRQVGYKVSFDQVPAHLTDGWINAVLEEIDGYLRAAGIPDGLADKSRFPGFPAIDHGSEPLADALAMEHFDEASCAKYVADHEGLLNDAQRAIYEEVLDAVECEDEGPKAFFVDGPGGTKKTYLFNFILSRVRSAGNGVHDPAVAIAVATSGVAALLLPGGRTAHSRFRIPIKVEKGTVLPIAPFSALGRVIKRARVIIWDEAPIANRLIIEAFDADVARRYEDEGRTVWW